VWPRARRRRPIIGPILLGLSLIVCLSVLSYPWWAADAIVYQNGKAVSCENYWTTVYPSGTYAIRCGGAAPPGSPGGAQLHTPSVASVTSTSVDLVLLSGLLSGLAALLAFLPRPGFLRSRGRAAVVLTVGLLAVAASFGGAIYFMEELPHAWQSDDFTYQTGDSHTPSWAGGNEEPVTPGINETWSWGPAVGWYIPWAAGALALVGSVFSWWALWRGPRSARESPHQPVRRGFEAGRTESGGTALPTDASSS